MRRLPKRRSLKPLEYTEEDTKIIKITIELHTRIDMQKYIKENRPNGYDECVSSVNSEVGHREIILKYKTNRRIIRRKKLRLFGTKI